MDTDNTVYYLCEFKRERVLELESQDLSNKEFCDQALIADPVEFAIEPKLPVQRPFERYETERKKIAFIDYNNDGEKENVLALALYSARGCDKHYYEVIEDDLKTLVETSSSLLESECGYKTHFIIVDGKTALVSDSEYEHIPMYISIQNKENVTRACTYKDKAILTVSKIYDFEGSKKIDEYSTSSKYFIDEYHKSIGQ